MATIPAAIAVLMLLPWWGWVPYEKDVDLVLDIGVIVASCLLLTIGLRWPKIFGWHKKSADSIDAEVYYGQGLRISLFESVVCIAFVTRYLGGRWLPVIIAFALATVGFILTYPTSRRWADWHRRSTEQ